MIAGLMVYSLIVACLLLFVGGLLDRTAVLARMPRRWIWVSAFVTTIALSMAAPWRPFREDAAPLPGMSFRGVQDAEQVAQRRWLDRIPNGLGMHMEMTPRVGAWLTGVWLSASFGFLVIWIAAHRALSRRRRTWRPALVNGVTIVVSPYTGPAVVGLLSPQIVVPAWVLDCDERSLDLILRHESEHVRMGDVWLTQLVGVVLLLMPWNPFVWWMASRLRLAVEFDCDARVISSLNADDVSGPAAYGELLLNIATRRSTRSLLVTPALIESSSTLGRRIAAMFPNLVRFGPVKIVAAAGAALVLVILAFTVRLPPATETGRGEPPEASAPAATMSRPPGQSGEAGPAAPIVPPPGSRAPVVLHQPKPGYTPEAMRARIQGIVTIEAVVGTDGRVRDARVIRSLDKEFGLDEAALDAARRWEFRPGTAEGRPVPVAVTLELEFTIRET